jgi:prevent-host-death family protein
MALARFTSSTEAHNQLSKLLDEVREGQALYFITLHGQPKYALLPVEVSPDVTGQVIGVRDFAKSFSKYLKALEAQENILISSRRQVIAQLFAIDPDDVDDMILAYNRPLLSEAKQFAQTEAADRLKSISALMDELKVLRAQNRSQA